MPKTIECARCGKKVGATGNSQKYCSECAYLIRLGKAEIFREALQAARESGKTKLKHITCEKCGADVVVPVRSGRTKYCPKCSQKEFRASIKRCRERAKSEDRPSDGGIVTTICNSCGVEFSYQYKGYYRTLCEDCKGANCGAGGPYKHGSDKSKKKKARVSQIDAIQRAAHAAGMSYGKYKAMLALQEMKKSKKGA